MRETRERIAAIEDEARRREDAAEYLRIEYGRLRGTEEVDEALRRRAHERVHVVLATRAPHFYSSQSTALNRFLVSRLVALGLVEHRQGELVDIAGGTPARVRLVEPLDDPEFYDVVTRIGPASVLARHLPSVDELCAARLHPGDPDSSRVPLDWSSLKSPALSPPAVTPQAPIERSTVAYYATSRQSAVRIVSSRAESIDIDAEEPMPYYFFLELEQAWRYATKRFGIGNAAVVEVLIQEPPPDADALSIRPRGPDGRLPMRTTDEGVQFILIRDLSYVRSPTLASRVHGEDK
jgi:hypothetical protein